MKWYKTKKHLDLCKNLCKRIAEAYQITLSFKEIPNFAGQACMYSRSIVLNDVSGGPNNEQMTEQRFLSTFCHEVAHILNSDEGKFPIYHDKNNRFINTPAYYRTAWRAEKYTDKVGQKIMLEFFPEIPYLPVYDEDVKEGFLLLLKEA